MMVCVWVITCRVVLDSRTLAVASAKNSVVPHARCSRMRESVCRGMRETRTERGAERCEFCRRVRRFSSSRELSRVAYDRRAFEDERQWLISCVWRRLWSGAEAWPQRSISPLLYDVRSIISTTWWQRGAWPYSRSSHNRGVVHSLRAL